MIKVGLTGGIGSGKSTVSQMLKEFSIPVIDADVIAREVLSLYPIIMEQVKVKFGENYIDEEGNLKRHEFGDFIFKNPESRKQYEAIIIPYIVVEVFSRIEDCENKGSTLCILDAPTLIEHNLHKAMDINILVWANSEKQIQRIMNRDKITLAATLLRIKAQMPLDEKKKNVDYVIDNSTTVENTKGQLEIIINEIKNRGKK